MVQYFDFDSTEILTSHSFLICPVCKEALTRSASEKSFNCLNNHSFDVSKQGYINLLTNSQKNSNQPGDSKKMVQARRDFLSKGYYSELSSKMNQFIFNQLQFPVTDLNADPRLNANSNSTPPPLSILDIGCGEGYYTNELMKLTKEKSIPASFVGLDISRDAIKFASSSNKEILWVVGNSHYLPIEDSSLDCELSVFSPVKIPEVIRTLKDDGVFIRVLPGANHLIEIRNIIYPNVILAEEKDLASEYEGLILKDELKVSYAISLDNESILALVQMTPHYWKTSKDNKEALKEIESLNVTIDMHIGTFSKSS